MMMCQAYLKHPSLKYPCLAFAHLMTLLFEALRLSDVYTWQSGNMSRMLAVHRL
jgi:hypothetical protein